jgi:predicted DNA-binding transcriptional regulator AlpA
VSARAACPPVARRLLRRALAADYLDMGLSTFDREVKEGRLPPGFPTTGGLLRWDMRDLDAWIDERKERGLARASANAWDAA